MNNDDIYHDLIESFNFLNVDFIQVIIEQLLAKISN